MRKLLLLFVLALTAIGVKAANFTWTSSDGQYTVTASNVQIGNSNTYQKLEVSGPGALAAFVEKNQDPNNLLMGVGGNADRVNLQITGELSADDFSALNSSTVSRWGTFTSLDLSGATISSIGDMEDMNMSGLKYLRLPSNLTDQEQMSTLKNGSHNTALSLVLSTDAIGNSARELHMHSFVANSVPGVMNTFLCASVNNGFDGFAELKYLTHISMSGIYGDQDLVQNGTSLNFNTAAVWDFTGADFEACNVDASVCDRGPYYASNDPFRDGSTVALTNSYPSNAFYYFRNYSTKVVEITLPTEITELPPSCMMRLGEENGPNYRLIHGTTGSDAYYPIDQLVIPDNIVTVGFECCRQSVVKSVLLGLGVKEVQGGAFLLNRLLESLDAKTGINNCRLGDKAFQECNNMKHVVLHEGIISLGAYCFDNSQELESIRLPETLTAIGDFCFMNGHALSSITIPENVEKIGKGAFSLTALTDVYLTTTDPAKVPEIWTAGTGWGDNDATFSINQLYGNNAIPYSLSDAVAKGVTNMTWDEAVEWYYAHANRIAQLHYPSELAAKVLAYISEEYGASTTDGFGIPVKTEAHHDQDRRATGDNGAVNMGSSSSTGTYTSDGWAQFLLMKEYVPNKPGGDVFTKEYDDVWYTMCFPFDLTDEQLASAFNEGFNIVDFSGVEVTDDDVSGDKTLTLHFNKVAKTIYKDLDGNVYTVTGRAQDGSFEYNIYQRDGQTYRHVQVGESGALYKTKTFALNGDKNNEIIMIDGILASAGHPYMVHPNTGANTGMPLTRCHFSGISWKPADQWEAIFNDEARTVDLGIAAGDPDNNEADGDNFMQKAYGEYSGQTYTFKGNWTEYGSEGDPEPPVPAEPQEPVAPTEPTEVSQPTEPRMTDPEPLTSEESSIYSIVGDEWFWGPFDEITCSYSDDPNTNQQRLRYRDNSYKLRAIFSEAEVYQSGAEATFNKCKEVFNKAKSYVAQHAAYLANKALWDAYDQYIADLTAYQNYDSDQAWADYQEAKREYEAAVAAHEQWEISMASHKKLIPTGAYFLGRRGRGWPKFYREIADDTRTDATGGFWTQYTAVVIPDAAAIAGIENELGAGTTAESKTLNMVFDEAFMGFYEPTEIKEIVAEAEEKGQEVKHVNIVVSINGQVVRRDSTSLEGLPTGLYIVNGKKYYVK